MSGGAADNGLLPQHAALVTGSGITPGLVRREAVQGKLEAAAVTVRGGRLFRSQEVRRYVAQRKACRAGQDSRGGRR